MIGRLNTVEATRSAVRILITGIAGFIGSHVGRILAANGHTLYGVVPEGESTHRIADYLDRLYVLPLDLTNTEKVGKAVAKIRPELAIHLAWYAVPGRYWIAPENVDCVAMSFSLAKALAGSGCKRFVAAGSCAEYNWDYGFLSEQLTPTNPRTLYGACKDALRRILHVYFEQTSMEFAWTRFFYIYGPGEQKERLVPSVILSLLRGEKAKCTHGNQIRDFLHVDDIASAFVSLLESNVEGPINIASGQPVALKTIIYTIANLLGKRDLVELGVLPAPEDEPLFIVADVRKLNQQVGWKPKITLEAGLKSTIEWWEQNLKGDKL